MWLRMAREVIYIFYSYVFSLYTVLLTSMTAENNCRYHKNESFCLFIMLNKYVSNLYILGKNPGLSSYTIGVTYLDYILLLLLCGNCPLPSKTGGCSDLLESTQPKIPLIKSSHKWTRILFILSNSKLRIWIFSQPSIDLNSQSDFIMF